MQPIPHMIPFVLIGIYAGLLLFGPPKMSNAWDRTTVINSTITGYRPIPVLFCV